MDLFELRKQAGLTQQQLAEQSGISISTIQKYEQGVNDINSASLATAIALNNVLKCGIDKIQPENWISIKPDPGSNLVAEFEDLEPEYQVVILKECAEIIGWTVLPPV